SLSDHRSKLSWTRYAFNLHQVAKCMGKIEKCISFHVNTGSRVLNKEVGCWSIHSDYAANQYRVSLRGIVGAQTTNLIHTRDEGIILTPEYERRRHDEQDYGAPSSQSSLHNGIEPSPDFEFEAGAACRHCKRHWKRISAKRGVTSRCLG